MSVHKYSTTPDSNSSVGDGSDAVGLQEGMPRQNVNNAMRAIAADIAKNYKDHGSLVTAGTGAAFTVFAQSDFTAYFVGMSLVVKLHADCASGATINVNGRGAKVLRMRGNNGTAQLNAGSLKADEIIHIVYNGSQFHVLGAFDFAAIHSRIAALEAQATSGTVNDADKLDGQHGAFYQNAANINSGTLPAGRLSGSYTITASNATNAANATNAGKLDNLNSTDFARYAADGSIGNALAAASWITSSGSNKDHVWHDDSANMWHFVSDGTFKQDGNAKIKAGSFYGDGANVTNVNAQTLDGINGADFLRSNASDTTSGSLTVQGELTVGQNGGGDSKINFYDDGSNTTRALYFDTSASDWRIEDGAGSNRVLWHSGNHGSGSSLDADKLDGLHEATFMRRSANSNLDLNNYDIVGADKIVHEGDTDTYIQFHAADQFRVVTGGTERFEINNSRTQIDNLEVTGYARVGGAQMAHAGQSVGAVGTYAFLRQTVANTARSAGATRAGSGLRYANANGYNSGTPGGTWRLMGYIFSGSTSETNTSLWMRIS